jgi:hypothetical protein
VAKLKFKQYVPVEKTVEAAYVVKKGVYKIGGNSVGLDGDVYITRHDDYLVMTSAEAFRREYKEAPPKPRKNRRGRSIWERISSDDD